MYGNDYGNGLDFLRTKVFDMFLIDGSFCRNQGTETTKSPAYRTLNLAMYVPTSLSICISKRSRFFLPSNQPLHVSGLCGLTYNKRSHVTRKPQLTWKSCFLSKPKNPPIKPCTMFNRTATQARCNIDARGSSQTAAI